jgi:hypothetical protein
VSFLLLIFLYPNGRVVRDRFPGKKDEEEQTQPLIVHHVFFFVKLFSNYTQMYKKLDQQNRQGNKVREVTTSGIMRNMAKYCLSMECTEDN